MQASLDQKDNSDPLAVEDNLARKVMTATKDHEDPPDPTANLEPLDILERLANPDSPASKAPRENKVTKDPEACADYPAKMAKMATPV